MKVDRSKLKKTPTEAVSMLNNSSVIIASPSIDDFQNRWDICFFPWPNPTENHTGDTAEGIFYIDGSLRKIDLLT